MSTETLEDLITQAIALKAALKGGGKNTDFALFSLDNDEWRADCGGSSMVMLGEVDGQFRGEGSSIRAAVKALIENIRAVKPYNAD